MKSKLKISKHSDDNSTLINYYKHKTPTSFRYSLFNHIINEIDEDVVLILDTNRKIKKFEIEEIEARLSAENIFFLKSPIKAFKRKLFGLQIFNFRKKQVDKPAYVLFFELSKDQFNQALFDELLYAYDLAFGIGKKKELTEIQSLYLVDFNHVMFNQDVFEDTIYDSVIFAQLRSSLEISEILDKLD